MTNVTDTVDTTSVGNTPTNVPDRLANLWLTYDLSPSWQTGVDARILELGYLFFL